MTTHYLDSVKQSKNEHVGLVFLELSSTCENGFKWEKELGVPGKQQNKIAPIIP